MKTLKSKGVLKDGKLLRSVKVQKLNYYYYSDLTDIYGSGFVKFLQTPPIKQRVLWGTNSNDCRLVNVSEFKSALKLYKQHQKDNKKVKTTASSVNKVKPPVAAVKVEETPAPVSAPTKPAVAQLTFNIPAPAAQKKTEPSVDKESRVKLAIPKYLDKYIFSAQPDEKFVHVKEMYFEHPIQIELISKHEYTVRRKEVNDLVVNFCNYEEKVLGLPEDSRTQPKYVYQNLFTSFRATMKLLLHKEGKRLEDMNLHLDDTRYQDKIFCAGVYPLFYNMVKELHKNLF